MRTYIMHKFESAPVIIGVVFIGFFVAALLVSADWVPPLATPPTCATGNPGCDPPVNTGGAGQVKTGGLTVASQPVTGGIGFTVLNGNVGIGTATPQVKLHIGDGINASSVTGVSPMLRVTSASFSTGFSARRDGYSEIAMVASGIVPWMGSVTNHPLLLYTNNTEKVRIDTSGNVGIGTATPGSKLQVVGDIRSERVGFPSQFMYLECGGGTCFVKSSATQPIAFAPAGSEKMTITTAGNVGIGTAAPSYRLDVQNNVADYVARIYNSNTSITSNGLFIRADQNSTNKLLTLQAGPSTAVLDVLGNGNVGIGTANPTQKLDVVGNITATKVFNPVYAP